MSALVWTTKSTKNLARALTAMGHSVSDRTVARMLRAQGFSLRANTKVTEGRQHEDRDAQFRYLAEQVAAHSATGQPVISVDAKKKELVGAFKNGGREYHPSGTPELVNVHDFPDKELGKAIPYGIYDVSANAGWVTVGTDHDTSAFAVATMRSWWATVGRSGYPTADRLLICADSGVSNGSRARAWKIELAAFAADAGLRGTVAHLPPGTSKWNKIEHRLFSQITMNWRGRPLKTRQIIVDLIANTSTATGLTVRCTLDTSQYPTGIGAATIIGVLGQRASDVGLDVATYNPDTVSVAQAFTAEFVGTFILVSRSSVSSTARPPPGSPVSQSAWWSSPPSSRSPRPQALPSTPLARLARCSSNRSPVAR